MGYDPALEIPSLSHWLSNVHVKDRTLNRLHVIIGTGSGDYADSCMQLRPAGYQGPLILKTVRGGDRIGDATRNLDHIQAFTGRRARKFMSATETSEICTGMTVQGFFICSDQ